MGLLGKMVGKNGNSMTHYGGHSMDTQNVLAGVADSVTPMTQINWTTANPTVIHEPKTATMAEADRAEKEAHKFEQAVFHGLRVLRSETKKQQEHAKLVKGHRAYLGETAQCHLEIGSANRGLAGRLQGMREAWAQMGHGLDRKQQTADQRIEMIAAKYQGGR